MKHILIFLVGVVAGVGLHRWWVKPLDRYERIDVDKLGEALESLEEGESGFVTINLTNGGKGEIVSDPNDLLLDDTQPVKVRK